MNTKEFKKLTAQLKQQAMSQARARNTQDPRQQYSSFSASRLYCAKCKQAMPVREKLLLALPTGDLYDYLCSGCGQSLGTKSGR